MAFVYKHIRKDTNEIFYIGIGKNKRRLNSKESRNPLWKNIVNKSDYYVEIIKDGISWETACKLESKLIKQYGRVDLGTGILANMTDGGEGLSNVSDEIKEKIVKSRSWYSHSDEAKKKMSDAKKGIIFSEEHKRKLSESAKKRPCNRKGVTLSEETKQKISKNRKGKGTKPKKL